MPSQNFFCDPCNTKTQILSFHKDLDSLISEQRSVLNFLNLPPKTSKKLDKISQAGSLFLNSKHLPFPGGLDTAC